MIEIFFNFDSDIIPYGYKVFAISKKDLANSGCSVLVNSVIAEYKDIHPSRTIWFAFSSFITSSNELLVKGSSYWVELAEQQLK